MLSASVRVRQLANEICELLLHTTLVRSLLVTGRERVEPRMSSDGLSASHSDTIVT